MEQKTVNKIRTALRTGKPEEEPSVDQMLLLARVQWNGKKRKNRYERPWDGSIKESLHRAYIFSHCRITRKMLWRSSPPLFFCRRRPICVVRR